MADTVESLKTELKALREEFETFRNYALPVIDAHQPSTKPPMFKPNTTWMLPAEPFSDTAE
jgi:hypothetical protein